MYSCSYGADVPPPDDAAISGFQAAATRSKAAADPARSYGTKAPPEGLMQLSPGGNTSSSGLSTATFRGDAAAQSHQTGLVMSTYHLVATVADDSSRDSKKPLARGVGLGAFSCYFQQDRE